MTDAQRNRYTVFKAADAAYRIGDSISDAQLAVLVAHYRAAEVAMVAVYNPTYELVVNDLRRRVSELEGYTRARAESAKRKAADAEVMYASYVLIMEQEGLTTSDAQAVADVAGDAAIEAWWRGLDFRTRSELSMKVALYKKRG